MAEQAAEANRQEGSNRRKGVTLGLLALALALTAAIAIWTEPLDPDRSCCDGLFYRSMAYNLFRVTRPKLNEPPPGISLSSAYDTPYYGQYYKRENKLNRQPPYVYRVVAPMLARAMVTLPRVDIAQAFHALGFLSIIATGWLLGLSVYELSRDPLPAAVTVVVVASLYWITQFHLWYTTLIDPLAYALIALGLWLIIRHEDRWFYAVALAGVFTKETVFFLLAMHLVRQVVERRLRWPDIAAYGLIGSCYLIFRLAMPIPNDAFTIANTFLDIPSPRTLASVTLKAFGVLSLFTVSRIWFCRTALYLIPFPLGVLVASMFTPDQQRLIVYVFPLVFLAVFAHAVQGALPRALLITPGALSVAFRLFDVWVVDFSTIEWALIYALAWLAVEPMFFATTRWLPLQRLPGKRATHHP